MGANENRRTQDFTELKAQIDPEAFEQMRASVSFPFKPGQYKRIAVKVIDFRGNEVVRVMKLDKLEYTRR